MSDLNEDEERMLKLLLKKQLENVPNVLQLIQGGRIDPKHSEQLRAIVKEIEKGEIVEYAVVGVLKESGRARLVVSHLQPSALLISAICHADEFVRRTMTFGER